METKCITEFFPTYAPAITSQPYTQGYSAASVEGIKDLPNGWSFNWASMAMRGRESLEARGVESLPVVYTMCPCCLQ